MTTLMPVANTTAAATTLIADATQAASPRVARRVRSRLVPVAVTTFAADVVSVSVVAMLGGAHAAPRAGLQVVSITVLWVVLLLAFRAYHGVLGAGARHRAPAALRAGAALGLCCWAMPVFVETPAPPRTLVVATLGLTALGVVVRLGTDAWSARLLAAAKDAVLVAGEPQAVARAVAQLRRAPHGRFDVVSACLTAAAEDVDLDVPVTVGLDDIVGAADAAQADAVLLLPCHELDPHRLRRLGWELEALHTRLFVATGLLDVAPFRTAVISMGDLSLVKLRTPTVTPGHVAKAVIDRVGAAVLLLLLAPLLAAVAVAVRLDSPGPVIFRQTRIGRRGREFTMLKFRTMAVDAERRVSDLATRNESEGALLFKIRHDPRITRVGAWLRRYSIDEVPQLVNVLRGDMALVGPRPALPTEVARYEIDPRRRLAVKPGLTGLWQVSGRSDLSWEETVRLDLHYVDNWSLGLDLRIFCRTLRAVLTHDGAY